MHDPVNQKNSYNRESHKLKVICPRLGIFYFCYNRLFWLFWQSLAASNRCLVSSRCSFHLLCLDHRRDDCFRFFRFGWLCWNKLFLGFLSGSFYWLLCSSWNRFFDWLLNRSLFNDFLTGWILFFISWSALASRLLNDWFHLLSCFLFLFDCDWRLSFLNGRLSFSNWGFHASFFFETLHNFFQSESWLFQVDFEFNGILLWDVDFLLKSVCAFLLEIVDVCGGVNVDSSKVVFFGGIFFCEFKGKSNFSAFIKVRQVEIELTSSERHDMSAVGIYEISVSGDFVLVKFLLS